MNRAIGFAVLAVGVVLVIIGISAADAPMSDISRFFTGEPTDRAIWFLVGGVAAIVVGGVMSALGRRSSKA